MPSGPSSTAPRDRDRVRAEHRGVDAAQRLELVRCAGSGAGCRAGARARAPSVEQVGLRADAGADRHHDRLADRVDRRVGDLREQLLEVGEQRRRLVGEHREREVVAHRADRLLALGRHRREQHAQVLLRVAERELAGAQRLARDAAPGARAGPPAARRPSRTTRRTGRRSATALLDLLVLDDPALVEVDQEELARLQAALAQRRSRPARRARRTPRRARPSRPCVSIQRPGRRPLRSSVAPITRPSVKADRRRPVPRLHHARVERVERAQVLGQVVALLPRLRHHHHQRVREAAAGEHEQLEHVVERRRVRAAGPDDRQHLLRGRRRTARRRAATRARASS